MNLPIRKFIATTVSMFNHIFADKIHHNIHYCELGIEHRQILSTLFDFFVDLSTRVFLDRGVVQTKMNGAKSFIGLNWTVLP